MTATEKLSVIRAANRRNDEAVKGGFLKVQRLSNTIRVVIEPWYNGAYRISAQMYNPEYSYSWETRADGWHNTCARFSTSIEGAKRVFDEMVRSEQRWVEQMER